MNLTMLDFLPIALYLLLLVWEGFRKALPNKDRDQFMLGARSLTLPAFVATLVTTWYGGILGIGEFIYTQGISVFFVFGLPYYVFAVIYAFVLAPKIRKTTEQSIPELFRNRYGRPAGLLSGLFLMIMTSPAPYLLQLAVILQWMTGFPLFPCAVAGVFFSMLYVMTGGFNAVVRTDKLQFCLMYGGFILLAVFMLIRAPLSFSQVWERLSDVQRNPTGGMNWQNLVVWFFIASWTFVDPGFHQRCAAARTPGIAKRGVLVSVIFWFVFDMLTLFTGLYAVALLPGIDPKMGYPLLTAFMPGFVRGLFVTGLLAVVMSTIDSYSFLSASTLGRDIVGIFRANEDQSVTHTRVGLVITALVALMLIYLMPSVVGLWYTLGSLFIPALILPLIMGYYRRYALGGTTTFLVMVTAFLVSLGWFLWGQYHQADGWPVYPLGWEPFFPGLLISLLAYLMFRKQTPGHDGGKPTSK